MREIEQYVCVMKSKLGAVMESKRKKGPGVMKK